MATAAVFIALGGGAYAAVRLPRNSVGPRQIRANAVRSVEVKNRSLLRKDFKGGQIPAGPQGLKGETGPQGVQGPPGPTFGATSLSLPGFSEDPPASPDELLAGAQTIGRTFTFTLPSSGNVYLRFHTPGIGRQCSAGEARAGLYLDGAPLPATSVTIDHWPSIAPREWVGVTAAGAGRHEAAVREDCPMGDLGSAFDGDNASDWTALLLGG